MKTTVLIFLLLLTFPSFAQQKALVLTKIKTEKTKVYQENKRIKVKTFDGEKFKGKLKIIDVRTIEIDGDQITLDSIKNIQNKPLALEIVNKTLMGLGGIIVIAAFASNSLVGYFLIVAGPTIASPGILFDNLIGNHKSKKWDYKIIEYEQAEPNNSSN